MNRRAFLKASAAAVGIGAFSVDTHAGIGPARSRSDLIDVNVNLSRWPLRRLLVDDTRALVAMLRRQRVVQAWAGSLDGLLHEDIASANARLAEECYRHGRGLLVPFGSINPKLLEWEEDLRGCAEVHRMPGIRRHPNYRGYTSEDPAFVRLLRLATERRMIVQLALVMEDEHMMHPFLRVEPVNTAPLPTSSGKRPAFASSS